jgi:hypothetical protein
MRLGRHSRGGLALPRDRPHFSHSLRPALLLGAGRFSDNERGIHALRATVKNARGGVMAITAHAVKVGRLPVEIFVEPDGVEKLIDGRNRLIIETAFVDGPGPMAKSSRL